MYLFLSYGHHIDEMFLLQTVSDSHVALPCCTLCELTTFEGIAQQPCSSA